MVNEKPHEKLVFSVGVFFVVGVAGAAAVRFDPRLGINETNQVSERRVYLFVFYLFGLKKNPAIIRRLHSSHCSSLISHAQFEISHHLSKIAN
jgi:hypothetical protein